MAESGSPETHAIDTLLFDVDDTLYPVSSGFSDHRNGEVIQEFLLERIGFTCAEKAMSVRLEYFKRFHSSMKGLAVACKEGKLPRPFREQDLSDWFADRCNFPKYLKPNPELAAELRSLRDVAGLKLAIFSNAPRRYVLRCLDAMAIRDCFRDEDVFGVEAALPACKPEAAAFNSVLNALGASADRTVMFEDSMKNIRACREMGMHTVLIDEPRASAAGEAGLLEDAACSSDPAVGAVLQSISQLREKLPFLWQRRFEARAPPGETLKRKRSE
eukprot:TRINITY_DN52638_c0_g1_i1.p1 TRINITY_DN52638_c0_g1~~TRINITY_DN52638_c0_g1_i1.p1  ORF type:complete len:282 (+),score=75.07 TRINITY_DN52638_c0_g1_i1:29-847(+)